MEIGSKEIITQKRIIGLFEKSLKYTNLRDWTDRDNSHIEEAYLRKYMKETKLYSATEISSAFSKLKRSAGNVASGLYHANKRYIVCSGKESTTKAKHTKIISWSTLSVRKIH